MGDLSDESEAAPGARTATREIASTCCYCGVGCGVLIQSTTQADGSTEITDVRGDPAHRANYGRLCSKGSTLALTASRRIADQVRLGQPELRESRDGPRRLASWDEAMSCVARRFLDIIRRHGPDAVAFYISGQLLTEDYYVFNKLAKGLVGTNNIDTNSRLCMSSAVAGYKKSLGADTVPCCYEDLDCAATVFIVGANPAFAHPVLYQRMRQARLSNPLMRVIVVDPRRTDSAEESDLFLQIRPGTDVWLFHAMLKIILEDGLADSAFIAAHTEGFAALAARVQELSLDEASRQCGIEEELLIQAARAFARGPTLSLWCQGLNQSSSGTDKNTALINLHLATGQIGKPGAGPFSLTGQPNAMGGREVGGMANLLSAHRDLGDPTHRAEIARFWGVPSVPARPGKTAVEMFDALGDGEIRAIWIACTNPSHSLPDQRSVRSALQRAEFVVVQDAYRDTATTPFADVLLPATTWGEKDGTVTNSDRTISRVRSAQSNYRLARHDWEIATDFARRVEPELRAKLPSLFSFTDPEQIWNEHRATTIGRDLDIGGLSYAILERDGPQQWPYPAGARKGTSRLYEDGVFATSDGRARFTAPEPKALADGVDRRFNVAMTSGRLRDQWHGMARTGTLGRSFAHVPHPVVEISERDAAGLQVSDGDLVYVTGRRASQILPAQISSTLMPGHAFIAMHWSDAYVSGSNATGAARGPNDFFPRATDPVSKQPELKHAAVKLLKADLAWHWVACAWLDADQALRVQSLLRDSFRHFQYVHCVPFGREQIGLEWRVANDYAPSAGLKASIEELLGIKGPAGMLTYSDARFGNTRRIRMEGDLILGFSVCGDIRAARWLRQYLESREPIAISKRRLLSPGREPPGAVAPRSRIVCNCAGVKETTIGAYVAAELKNLVTVDALHAPGLSTPPEAQAMVRHASALLEGLRTELRCGAQCGSCIPELRRIVKTAQGSLL